jgi:2-amino-4-hydroxy-6-hydroxymethyldihydropteridine diphosphokinase/dihydropteroate synthase
LDLDLLHYEGISKDTETLRLPHPEILNRAFVLDPLKDLAPRLRIGGNYAPLLRAARKHPGHSPVFMGILNFTPDSFSDGGRHFRVEDVENYLETVDKHVGIVDIGAESTRPGAKPLSAEDEWVRLKPVLELWRNRYKGRLLRPRLSLDTRHAEVAGRGLEYGVDVLNDVSGFADPGYLEVLRESGCDYVLMHSLSVPADKDKTLPQGVSPPDEVHRWLKGKLGELEHQGIDPGRVILDPGIGFGKTSRQSLELLRNFQKFWDLDCRLLIGHSRKSFFNHILPGPAEERDFESLGASVKLGLAGVDILRVHHPLAHVRAWKAAAALRPDSTRYKYAESSGKNPGL